MKKILITGMNREQCNRDFFLRKELKILNSQYSLIRCLEDMGWEVEQRAVTIGEDLSNYDEVIVYLHSANSFCQNIYDGLYAISARPNCILAFDDWQINQVLDNIRRYRDELVTKIRDPYRDYIFNLYIGNSSKEKVMKHEQDYINGCDLVLAKNNRLMICAFTGGDLNKMKTGWSIERMFQYNPNPYNMNRSPNNNFGEDATALSMFFDTAENVIKTKSWVFSSLMHDKTRKWLEKKNTKWLVNIYGSRRGKNKSERVIESEMCKVYQKNWGCLMPVYYHAGSGWWRSRVQQVVDVGSILFCEDTEGKIYGEAFTGLNINEIENMSDTELSLLAKRQYECLYANHPLNKHVQREEITRLLDAQL